MKRILLLGGSGQLGTALRQLAGTRIAAAPPHAAFDVTADDPDALLAAHPADAVVNCTAFHNVDVCEREPARAFAANAVAVDRLAAAAARAGVAFATVSTDYVFPGDLGRAYREDDPTGPRTAYGVSKLAGELLTRRHGPRHFVLRTSGLFGTIGTSSKGYTLIEKVLAQAARGEATRMVADMTFSPSFAPHVARALVDLIDADAFGTHHLTNGGACTWYEFVRTAFVKAGYADAPLEPITYASFGNPTPRPMCSPLVNTTFRGLGIAPLPPWETALDDFLAARRAPA